MYAFDQNVTRSAEKVPCFFLSPTARAGSGAQPHRAPFFPSHFTGFGTVPGLGWEGQQFFGNRTHLVQLSPSAEPALGSGLCSFLRSPACSPQGQPSDKILSRQQGWSVKNQRMTPARVLHPHSNLRTPTPFSQELGPASPTIRTQTLAFQVSPQSPLTQGGWAFLRMAMEPTALSFFCFTAATMPGLAPLDGQEQVRDTNYGAQEMA